MVALSEIVRGRTKWWAGGVAGVVAVVAVVGILRIGGPSQPAPRARAYTQVTTCLLAGAQGQRDARVAAAWAGLQDASGATHAQATFLTVAGPQTAGAALPYLNTLAQACRFIVAIGPAPSGAVGLGAAQHPSIRFAVDQPTPHAGNVSVLQAVSPNLLRSQVAALARSLGRS